MKKKSQTKTAASDSSAPSKPAAQKAARTLKPRTARTSAKPAADVALAPPPLPATRLVFFGPGAECVCVAGTFNNWDPESLPLKAERDGSWTIELPLSPGRHEYRFIVDGCWVDDPRAEQYVPNAFGGVNGLLEVRAAESGA